MVGSPIESIKLYFDLANDSEKELDEKTLLLGQLLKKTINLKNSLKMYKNLLNTDARDIGFDNVLDQLNQIDNAEELKLFVYLYRFYENKFFIAPDTGISLSKIINVLTYVDKFAPDPSLPWSSTRYCLTSSNSLIRTSKFSLLIAIPGILSFPKYFMASGDFRKSFATKIASS